MAPEHDPAPAPGEEEVWAEHRAALEATVFRPAGGEHPVVLELRDGALRPVRA